MSASPEDVAVKLFEESGCIVLPNIARKVHQWGNAYRIYTQSSTTHQYADLKSSETKTFLSLRVSDRSWHVPHNVECLTSQLILNTIEIHRASDLDTLPFEMIQEAVKFSKDLAIKGDSKAKRTIFLLTGV